MRDRADSRRVEGTCSSQAAGVRAAGIKSLVAGQQRATRRVQAIEDVEAARVDLGVAASQLHHVDVDRELGDQFRRRGNRERELEDETG